MKKGLIIVCFLLYTHLVFGQEKALTADSDITFLYGYYNTLGNKIKVDTARNINKEFFFRFWDGYKAIEIIKSNSEIEGNIIFFVQQYKRKKEGRIYSKHEPLTKANADKIYQLIVNYKLLELPTDDQIKGWEHGLDGITYVTEYADKNHYSFKPYWTPDAHNELVEAKQLLSFINEISQIQEINEKYAMFMQSQPFQSWYGGIGSETIVSKIITAR